jgi:ABC-type Fe3+-siderophore transport system permease subunit
MLHFKERLVSSFIVGINGNSDASIHLIFVFSLHVFICRLFHQTSSISTFSSLISVIKLVKSLLGIAKLHSEIMSIHSLIVYSIAISKLFETKTIFQ